MSPESYERDRIDSIDDPDAFRYCSGEELRALLQPGPGWSVAEFGSGTGRFTSELAPVTDTVYAVELRREMLGIYRDRGIPANVAPVVADFCNLPFPDDSLDGGVSVRTYHHGFQAALDEVARVVRPGGRLVIVDWSATGAGEREARDAHRYLDLATVQSQLLDAGFSIAEASERYETFVVVAIRQ